MPQNIKDSIVKPIDTVIPLKSNSSHIFKDHSLKPSYYTAIAVNKTVLSWPAAIFIISFILLVIVRVASAKRFLMLLKAYFSLGIARQLMREDYKLNKGSSVLFTINFLLCFSFFLFKINQYYQFNSYSFNNVYLYLILIAFTLISYILKFTGTSIIAKLTNCGAEMEEYAFNTFLSTNAIGLFLFPVVVCLEYSQLPTQYLLLVGIIITLVFYLIRLVKGFIIAFVSRRFSLFHLFLYLCTLEILPLIVTIKLFMSKIF